MKKLTKYIPLIPAALVLGAMMFPSGCANTTTPPSGGDKDTIPPVLVKTYPLPGAVNVPTHKTQVKFTFDEYVVVKDANAIFLSPPLEKKPKYKISGKSVIVSFESDLDSNRTYTLDITGAIADNNEGNMYEGFTLVFSTGSQIDSMCMTGIIQDCNTLMPIKGATVLLYKDQADSAIFLHRPDAAAKTDDWGFFSLRNIQDTVYRVYALRDANNNNIYEPDQESVGFLDDTFRPRTVYNDSIYELKKFNMKDTALCLARKTDVEINVFREKPSKQFIVKKERVGLRTAFLTFMAPGAKVNSMKIRGLPAEKLISQFNPQQKSAQRDVKHQDTIAVFKTEVDPTTVEQYGFRVEFQYPLIQDAWDSLVVRSVNPRQQEKRERYTVTQDPNNLRVYTIMPREKFQTGYDYFVKIPYRKFRDVNGHYNDSTEMKVTLPTDEKLSTVSLELTKVKHRYIIDLLSEKRDRVIRSFMVDSDQTIVFPYVKAGKYCIRMTEDSNKNGLVDTGNILEHRQPEKVKFYKIKDDFLLDIPERTEYEQKINMEELFK